MKKQKELNPLFALKEKPKKQPKKKID